MTEIIPNGAAWHHNHVASFHPEKNMVILANGEKVSYDSLVVAMGLKNDYEKIPGLKEALEDKTCPVGSIYDCKYATKIDQVGTNFQLFWYKRMIVNLACALAGHVEGAGRQRYLHTAKLPHQVRRRSAKGHVVVGVSVAGLE